MQIIVNGEPAEIPEGLTMARLIEQLELSDKRLAVEVNRELVPRSQFDSHRLTTGDQVEIIHAVGGG
jgi:sulfur carrier protein